MTITLGMVPEIWTAMKKGKKAWVYYHFTHLYHNWQSYDVWSATNNFLSFWTVFCPFTSPKDLENENFEKTRKKPGEIIILHMCTINDNHMIYGSWDMERHRQNLLSFWTVFCPFTPLTTRRIKILKKMRKTPGDIIILHKWNKNYDHILHCSWDTTCNGCNFYFSFWAISCPFTP